MADWSFEKPAAKAVAKSAAKPVAKTEAASASARYDLFLAIPGDALSYAYRVGVGKEDLDTKVGGLFGEFTKQEDGSYTRTQDGARIYAGVVTG